VVVVDTGRFGMGFLCGRSRRCGAVQRRGRVVEFLLVQPSLACECEDVLSRQGLLLLYLRCVLKVRASGRRSQDAEQKSRVIATKHFRSFNIYA
jgi:hypothetical protein